jgi:hypothetical protein
MAVRKNSLARGVKCITAALRHRRGDKYLFANQQEYRGTSYRVLWRASRTGLSFEEWLKERGIFAA